MSARLSNAPQVPHLHLFLVPRLSDDGPEGSPLRPGLPLLCARPGDSVSLATASAPDRRPCHTMTYRYLYRDFPGTDMVV